MINQFPMSMCLVDVIYLSREAKGYVCAVPHSVLQLFLRAADRSSSNLVVSRHRACAVGLELSRHVSWLLVRRYVVIAREGTHDNDRRFVCGSVPGGVLCWQ